MIKKYHFDYDNLEANVTFTVDTEKFTNEHAKSTLDFFTWDYDEDADPIDEVMKKYALEAIKIASANNYTTYGVIKEFNENEGFCKVDGSSGIKLEVVHGYEFDPDKLDVVIKIIKQ